MGEMVSVINDNSHWFNRNCAIVAMNWGDSIGPHASTERLTYTVPANKRTYIPHVSMNVLTVTAPSAAGLLRHDIFIIPSGGVKKSIAALIFYQNTLGLYRNVSAAIGVMLNAGDVFSINSGDFATGGVVAHAIGFAYHEFGV